MILHVKTGVVNVVAALSTLLALGLATVQAGPAYEQTILGDNPVAYYRLGEASGAVSAVDAKGGTDLTYEQFTATGFAQPGAVNDGNTSIHMFRFRWNHTIACLR